ncbi:MAG: alpha-amylase family glycosyl hydrolase [Patescibacteria group bacterium]
MSGRNPLRRFVLPFLPVLLGLGGMETGAAFKGSLRIDNAPAEVWDYRVKVMGVADGGPWAELSLVGGERPVDFSPRGGFFEVEIPLLPGENLIKAVGRLADGKTVESDPVRFFVPLGPAAHGAELPWVTEDRPSEPAALAVVYGTCVHLQSARGLAGVIDTLDSLAALGCNAVWLAPTFPTGRGGYGYDVTDYFAVRSSYGTLEEMRRLTREAHRRGIRVLLDLVPNHTSSQHPYFQDALDKGEKSHYRDFYTWESQTEPRHYFNWDYLPNLNYDHPEVRRMMLEVGRFWVGKIGIDGFRVDVAWGVQERRPGFWREWSAELRKIYPGLLLIAEASARWPVFFEEGYDAAYDWDDGFLPAWREVFDLESKAVERLDRALSDSGRGVPRDALVFRFVDNNDTGPRFHARYGPDKARLACLMLCTLPGIPLIYLGQENGASYQPYAGMEPVTPGDDTALTDLYRRMLALRKREPALLSPAWERLVIDPGQRAFAYLRKAPGAQDVVVVLNFSRQGGTFTVGLPQTAGTGDLKDAAFGRAGRLEGGRLRVDLDAYGGAVFILPRG